MVSVIGQTDGWYQVRYNGQVGYLSSEFVRLTDGEAAPTQAPASQTDPSPAAATGYPKDGTLVMENGGTLNIRKGPDKGTDSLGYIKAGAKLTVLGESGEWYQIQYKDIIGFIKKIYVVF